ncbi:MAG: hypothetical protein EOP34_02035 [Rickettsiales bacterium]|nr:MAG: hypothetical protein EOP34_02035 [Rickettsiales bacterium]
MFLSKLLLLISYMIYLGEGNILEWRELDKLHARAIQLNVPKIISDTLSPNSTSADTIMDAIQNNIDMEEAYWDGSYSEETVDTTKTWLYIKSILNISKSTAKFLRKMYGYIYKDIEMKTCNIVKRQVEIIVDQNLGYNADTIYYTDEELDRIVVMPTCLLPTVINDNVGYDDTRRYISKYIKFLRELDSFYECILAMNAYPAYTKAINCLEQYYGGSQDAGANPPFFQLMSAKQELTDYAGDLEYASYPDDIETLPLDTWDDLDEKLQLTDLYTEISRVVRTLGMQIYVSLTRNYLRLKTISICRYKEKDVYDSNTDLYWCQYTMNISVENEYHFFENIVYLNESLMQVTEYHDCSEDIGYPGPFFCDETHFCPGGYYCSLLTRSCLKNKNIDNLHRTVSFTQCGIPRKLVDLMYINSTSHIVGINDTNIMTESHMYTSWPTNCTKIYDQVADIQKKSFLEYDNIDQICYPFVENHNISDFITRIVNSTVHVNCSVLNETTLCFTNVTYDTYLDGVLNGNTTIPLLCITRSAVGYNLQINHCKPTIDTPIYFGDIPVNDTVVSKNLSYLQKHFQTYHGMKYLKNNTHNVSISNTSDTRDIDQILPHWCQINASGNIVYTKCTTIYPNITHINITSIIDIYNNTVYVQLINYCNIINNNITSDDGNYTASSSTESVDNSSSEIIDDNTTSPDSITGSFLNYLFDKSNDNSSENNTSIDTNITGNTTIADKNNTNTITPIYLPDCTGPCITYDVNNLTIIFNCSTNVSYIDKNPCFYDSPYYNSTKCDETNEIVPYMGCKKNNPNCVTYNSSHVCYHQISTTVEIYNYFLTTFDLVCKNTRIKNETVYYCYNVTETFLQNTTVTVCNTTTENDYNDTDTSSSISSSDSSSENTKRSAKQSFFNRLFFSTDIKNKTTCYNETKSSLFYKNITYCNITGYFLNVTDDYIDPQENSKPPAMDTIPYAFGNTTYTNTTRIIITHDVFVELSLANADMVYKCKESPTFNITSNDRILFDGLYIFTYKSASENRLLITGNITFIMFDTNNNTSNTCTFVGARMRLILSKDIIFYNFSQLVVDTNGTIIYNPIYDDHPNPRFNDATECYNVSIFFKASTSMRYDQFRPSSYAEYYTNDLDGHSFSVNGRAPVLQSCAPVYFRKIFYVRDYNWNGDAFSLEMDDSVRFSCQRSLTMGAACSRLGTPISPSDYISYLHYLSPPFENLNYDIAV